MEQTESQSFEKRKHPRVALNAEVTLESINKDSLVFGWVQDISAGGFKIRVDIPPIILKFFSLYAGDKVLFQTYEGFPDFRGRGDIRWVSNEQNNAGIKFDELDDNSKKRLDVFLAASS